MPEEKPAPRKVPTVVRVKAALIVGLPALLLALIGLGFVPMLEGGGTLWQAVGRKFFGAGDEGPQDRPAPSRRDLFDAARYREDLASNDRGRLMEAGMDLEEAIRESGGAQRAELEGLLAEVKKKLAETAPPKSDVLIPSGSAKPK